MNIIDHKTTAFMLLGLALFLNSCLKSEEINLNPPSPAAIRFADSDMDRKKISGSIVLEKADDEENIDEYILWWGKNADDEYPGLGKIAVLPKVGKRLVLKLSENAPSAAAYILAASRNKYGDSDPVRVLMMDASGVNIEVLSGSDGNRDDVRIFDLAASRLGIYIVGATKGKISFNGMLEYMSRNNPATDGSSSFTAKFDKKLTPIWVEYKTAFYDQNDARTDYGRAIAVDTENATASRDMIYVHGETRGNMFRYESEFLGRDSYDYSYTELDFFLIGYTSDYISEHSEMKSSLCNYDQAPKPCNLYFGRQLGTPSKDSVVSAGPIGARGSFVALSDNTLYTAGNYNISSSASDILIGIYDMNEKQFYHRTLGSGYYSQGRLVSDEKRDYVNAIAADSSGNLYVAGSTWGNLGDYNRKYEPGDPNAFLMRFPAKEMLASSCGGDSCGDPNIDGNEYKLPLDERNAVSWNRQIGTRGYDAATAAAIDSSGALYIAGHTNAELEYPESVPKDPENHDVFIVKIVGDEMEAKEIWRKQIGGPEFDAATDMVAASGNNVYLLATTRGSMFAKNSGESDIVLIKYSPDGDMIWGKQFGGWCDDSPTGIVLDDSGNIYIGGYSRKMDGSPIDGTPATCGMNVTGPSEDEEWDYKPIFNSFIIKLHLKK